MRRCLRLLLGAAAVSLALPPALTAQPAETRVAADRWRGTLSFRGDRWPVRLEVAEDGEGCAVRLDLPALVMAREPVGAECAGRGLTVEMPFGLGGGSQAGWLSLLAASRSDDVAFLVLRSAPAFTPSEQEEQSVVHRLRAAEHPEAHVQDALAHTRLFFYVTRAGRGWDELAASVRRAEEAGWGDFVQRPASPADLAWWRKHHDVDPLPLLRELDVPTLALYGGADPVVPPALNAPVFRHAVPEGTPVRVETFPLADHGLEVGAGRIEGERWRFPHRPDRMFEVLDAWLDEHVSILCSGTERISRLLEGSSPSAARRKALP